MTNSPIFHASDRVVATDLPDGTAVLLHLDTKFYFTLNTTAAEVFRALRGGAQTRPALASLLAARFSCDESQALADVGVLLDDLLADALIRVTHG
jgi:hypothetical protein